MIIMPQMFDIRKGNKIMQRSNKQVTPKRDLLPPRSQLELAFQIKPLE